MSEYKDHLLPYDYVYERTKGKWSCCFRTLIDMSTRESLGMVIRRKFTSLVVIEILSQLFITQGLPKYIRLYNRQNLN